MKTTVTRNGGKKLKWRREGNSLHFAMTSKGMYAVGHGSFSDAWDVDFWPKSTLRQTGGPYYGKKVARSVASIAKAKEAAERHSARQSRKASIPATRSKKIRNCGVRNAKFWGN